VTGSAAWTGPTRNLVSPVAGGGEEPIGRIKKVPLCIGIDLGQPAFLPPAVQERPFFETQAVAGQMLGA
jgi:hypothetical protein